MPLNRILLYVRDTTRSAEFYAKHFGFTADQLPGDRIVALKHPDGGAEIMLHQAGKSQKMGQVLAKLVFEIRDVAGFIEAAGEKGLKFGPVHSADGYSFANAKDPDKNSIQISSRGTAP